MSRLERKRTRAKDGAGYRGKNKFFTRGSRMGHQSIAPISCTRLWTGSRVRLSFKERRMRCREPTKPHRESGSVAGVECKSAFIPPRFWRRGLQRRIAGICPQALLASSWRMAEPAPCRSASFISEYLRERITPSAPPRNAANTASLVPSGVHLL